MSRLWWALVAVLALGYGYLAATEAADREADRPDPAPVGVTVDPTETPELDELSEMGFDFAAIVWSERAAGETRRVVKGLAARDIPYAFFVPSESGSTISRRTRDAIASFSQGTHFSFRGKPLVYGFGTRRVPSDSRFSFVQINGVKNGDQYWTANPPNIKNGFMTLAAGYHDKGIDFDISALDQQLSFAQDNADRAVLVLWHSWNAASDRSALVSHPGASERVRGFLADWHRP